MARRAALGRRDVHAQDPGSQAQVHGGHDRGKARAKIETPHGLRTCFEARIERDGKPDLVARFGGIPLVRRKNAVLHGHVPGPVPYPQKELIHRLLKRRCELCGEAGKVLVHQVRKLASLGEPGPGQPAWAAKMAQMRRKTLTVCRTCHDATHGPPPTPRRKSPESHVR